jgi:hypothetical protein
MNFPIVHGLKLAAGSSIQNFALETIASADAAAHEGNVLEGQIWYDDATSKFRMKDGKGVDTYITRTELTDEVTQYTDKLAKDQGASLIGVANTTGLNNRFSIVGDENDATVVLTGDKAIEKIVTAIDQDMQDLVDVKTALATKTGAPGKGATLVGTRALTTTNSYVTVAQGTVSSALKDIADSTDASIKSEKDRVDTNFLNKTDAAAQTVASEVTFNNNVKVDKTITVIEDLHIKGKIIQDGQALEVAGEQVMFEDSIIYLNSNATGAPVAGQDAGWGVNRGDEGNLDVVKWIETDKSITAYTKWTKLGFRTVDEVVNGVEMYAGTLNGDSEDVEVLDTIVVKAQFDHANARTSAALTGLWNKVGNSIGDMSTLKTVDQDTLVGAINEIHDENDVRSSDLADTTTGKGSSLVGYSGKTGLTNFSIAANTAKVAFDSIVSAIDSDRKEAIDRKAELATDAGSAEIGTKNVQGTNAQFSITSAAGTVLTTEAALAAITQGIDSNAQDNEDLSNELDAVVSNINANMATTQENAASTHTFAHNLNSEMLNVTVWTKEDVDGGKAWQNSIVATTIVDANNIKVELTTPKEVRIICEKVADVSRLFV